MKPKVLIVDDDKLLLGGLRRALHEEPYSILTATDGNEALGVLEREPCAVIISDEMMPNMNGVEFLSIAAKRFPNSIRVMLTGKADLQTAVRAINCGQIYRFLTKPCSEMELSITIQQAIQHRELLIQSRRMLNTLEKQNSYIEQLEKENPGISKIELDQDGAIVIDDIPLDANALLEEIGKKLDR